MGKYGFIRETSEIAKKSGIDKDTGIVRTGLDVYLKDIFPNIDDWVHDKIIPNCKRKIRPDYRSETLKLIVEFDGLPHYQNPDVILFDIEKDDIFKKLGYNVVRVPYFIQLTNKTIEKMFGIIVNETLFDDTIPSLDERQRNTPVFLCYLGVKRMASDFKKYPEQYKINIEYLKSKDNDNLTGAKILEEEFSKL